MRHGEGLYAAFLFAKSGYAVLVRICAAPQARRDNCSLGATQRTTAWPTLDWIAHQPWSDGKIGTFGCSALGETQLVLAARNHPRHLAMIPSGAGAPWDQPWAATDTSACSRGASSNSPADSDGLSDTARRILERRRHAPSTGSRTCARYRYRAWCAECGRRRTGRHISPDTARRCPWSRWGYLTDAAPQHGSRTRDQYLGRSDRGRHTCARGILAPVGPRGRSAAEGCHSARRSLPP